MKKLNLLRGEIYVFPCPQYLYKSMNNYNYVFNVFLFLAMNIQDKLQHFFDLCSNQFFKIQTILFFFNTILFFKVLLAASLPTKIKIPTEQN